MDFSFYLKQSLFLNKGASFQRPEVQVGFSAGHYDAGVRGVEIRGEYRFIRTLGKTGEPNASNPLGNHLGITDQNLIHARHQDSGFFPTE